MHITYDGTVTILLMLLMAQAVICDVMTRQDSTVASDNNNNSNNNKIEHTDSLQAGAACQSEHGMWGDVDPNVYYICDEHTRTARQLRCAEGRGFFKGLGYYGCIPYTEWPACLANRAAESPLHSCDDVEEALHTWAANNPNMFYMCEAQRSEPLLVSCEPGRGYVSAWVGNTQIVGCALWPSWRGYMQCHDYY